MRRITGILALFVGIMAMMPGYARTSELSEIRDKNSRDLVELIKSRQALEAVRFQDKKAEPAPVPKGLTYHKGLVVPADINKRVEASWAVHGARLHAARTKYKDILTFDCRDKGWVPPVKDQSQCGSCWDFSGTGVCSCAFMKAGYPVGKSIFSEQYTLDCGDNGGCNGDWPETVAKWAKTKGLPLDEEYGSYQARAGRCKSGVTLYKIADYGYVGSSDGVPDFDTACAAMIEHGPLSVCICADNEFSNIDGKTPWQGNGNTSINHAVMAVAFDKKKRAMLLRNSWGSSWADGGYAWVVWGANGFGYGAMWASAISINPPTPTNITIVSTPASIAPGGTVTFTSATTGTGTLDFGDGTTVFSGVFNGSLAHTYTSAGTYNATLTINGATGTVPVTVSTSPNPGPNPVPPKITQVVVDGFSFTIDTANSTIAIPSNFAVVGGAASAERDLRAAGFNPLLIPAIIADVIQLGKDVQDLKNGKIIFQVAFAHFTKLTTDIGAALGVGAECCGDKSGIPAQSQSVPMPMPSRP